MSSQDFSSDFHISDSGSRLLSESLISGNSSRTGHGGDDLSLSELSLQDRPLDPPRRKFSLFAQPPSPQDADESAIVDANDEEDVFGGEALNGTMKPEDIEKAQRAAAKTREERLQHDLLTLKKINAAFDVYKEAMRETQSNTDRVAEKLANTNALLDKYVTILAKSEKVTQLILDERWEGADADEAQIEHEIRLEQERRLQEEREREEAAQRERERLQREEEERLAKEERQRLEKEKEGSRSASRGSGVRGVRGTRASMRGIRGSTASSRGASTTVRNTPPSASTSIPTRRAGTTNTTRGTSRTSSVRK